MAAMIDIVEGMLKLRCNFSGNHMYAMEATVGRSILSRQNGLNNKCADMFSKEGRTLSSNTVRKLDAHIMSIMGQGNSGRKKRRRNGG